MARPDDETPPLPRRTRPLRAALAGGVATAAALEYVPSVVALGQWSPLRILPGRLCRWQGPRFPGHVAITFDDGPDAEGTPAVLDALDALGWKATFFVLGTRAREEPELVKETVRRGHQVATHGDVHEHHLVRSPSWVLRDLQRARATMQALGVPARWYRPAYGQATAATLVVARALGLETVLWSAWGREWDAEAPSEVAARIARRLRPGAIVLLHDSDRFGPPGMWRRGLEALALVDGAMRRRGLSAVGLDQLVG